MNKPALLTLVLLAVAAGPVLAVHSIGIFEDAAATDCEISDPGGATTKTFYIVENEPYPVFGSAWRLTWDAGVTMTWISDASPFFMLGNAMDGANLAYSVCTDGTFLLDSVTMLSLGTSAPCSRFQLGPHPTYGRVVFDCSIASQEFVAGDGIVNANGSCTCSVGIEQSTWGSVKALYR